MRVTSTLSFSICLFALVISSCQKTGSVQTKPSFSFESVSASRKLVSYADLDEKSTDKKAFDYLSEKLGIPARNIRLYDDSIFMISSLDMTYPRSQVELAIAMDKDEFGKEKIGQRMDMRFQNPDGIGPVNCTGFPKVPQPRVQISIYLDPALPADWNTAMVQAIAQWNSLGSRISFFVNQQLIPKNQGPYAWMDVRPYNDPVTSTVAYANLPAIGGISPGRYIRINTAYNFLPAGEKLFACVHELGHTIGYRHTDQTEGQWITGTPATDPASVMNAFVGPWSGFSSWDVFAQQKVYPYVTPTGCTY